MKRLILILAFFAAGCTHDLTAPLNSVPVTSMAEYFWTAGSSETLDSGKITDKIMTRDSSGLLLANDSNPDGTLRTTLVCRVSADSVFADGFKVGSLIDLDPPEMSFVDTNQSGTRHPGGILLLRANPLVDSSWPAGTIMIKSYQTYPIEARFLSRLDSLLVNGVSYPDVLAVRYAHEWPDLTVDSTNVPYWVIFYARGRGPIMFDKVGNGTFERRAILH